MRLAGRVAELGSLAVMKPTAVIVLLLALCQGCHTHSQCRRELFQIHYAAVVHSWGSLQYLDKGKIDGLRDQEIFELGESLSQLQKLVETAHKDDIDQKAPLCRSILKYAEAHKAELSRSQWTLEMLKALKALATDPANVKRVTELEEYVIAERKHLPILER